MTPSHQPLSSLLVSVRRAAYVKCNGSGQNLLCDDLDDIAFVEGQGALVLGLVRVESADKQVIASGCHCGRRKRSTAPGMAGASSVAELLEAQ